MSHTQSIAEMYTIQLQPQESKSPSLLPLPENMEPELAQLLHTYNSVFGKLVGLPPSRSHNHAIPLIDGASPVKSRPYRQPHSQKEIFEKMVQEMLEEGII